MENDSSITAIESLELENVTGGHLVIPNGGMTGQTQSKMNIPGGGSLTCSGGTVPDHTTTTTTIEGTGAVRTGIFKAGFKESTTTQHDTCAIPK
jgi:hypothetical protein